MTLKELYLTLFVIPNPYTPTPFIDETTTSMCGLTNTFSQYYSVTVGLETYHPYQSIDRDFLCVKYGDLKVLAFEKSHDNEHIDAYSEVLMQIHSVIFRKAYKWKNLFDTMNFEYNPLWNVDGTEKTTYSQFEKDDDIPQKTTTESIGVKKRTDTYGAESVTATNSNVPVDNTTYYDTQKQENSSLSHEDVHTDDATATTTTVNSYIDKHIEKEHTVTIERSGNIGVTKTTELIDSQRDIVNFDFYEIVFKDIVDEICVSGWGD